MKIMDDDDVIALDHQPRRYDQRHRGVHSWGDRQNGRLVQSAKGIGLSRALKALLGASGT
jgi:hypothetical protein